jgi:hypothetical protein
MDDEFFKINEVRIPHIKLIDIIDNVDKANDVYKKVLVTNYKTNLEYIDLVNKDKHHYKINDMSGDIMGSNKVSFDVVIFNLNDLDTIKKNIIKYCIGEFHDNIPGNLNIFGIDINPSSFINKSDLEESFKNTIDINEVVNTISLITNLNFETKLQDFYIFSNKLK